MVVRSALHKRWHAVWSARRAPLRWKPDDAPLPGSRSSKDSASRMRTIRSTKALADLSAYDRAGSIPGAISGIVKDGLLTGQNWPYITMRGLYVLRNSPSRC